MFFADIPLLSWAALSPDLNPNENVWAALRGALKQPLPPNSDELFALLLIWDGIDAYPYVSSMKREILSVIDANKILIKIHVTFTVNNIFQCYPEYVSIPCVHLVATLLFWLFGYKFL